MLRKITFRIDLNCSKGRCRYKSTKIHDFNGHFKLKCHPNSTLRNCQKIGEGIYGEVFFFRRPNGTGTSVIKVIPIEGDLMVNGEHQKKFEEIISEITIAIKLSDLRRQGLDNYAPCFSEVLRISCVRSCYHESLVELWELYDETRRSENDHPEIFDSDQMFMVLELANGGSDMEALLFIGK